MIWSPCRSKAAKRPGGSRGGRSAQGSKEHRAEPACRVAQPHLLDEVAFPNALATSVLAAAEDSDLQRKKGSVSANACMQHDRKRSLPPPPSLPPPSESTHGLPCITRALLQKTWTRLSSMLCTAATGAAGGEGGSATTCAAGAAAAGAAAAATGDVARLILSSNEPTWYRMGAGGRVGGALSMRVDEQGGPPARAPQLPAARCQRTRSHRRRSSGRRRPAVAGDPTASASSRTRTGWGALPPHAWRSRRTSEVANLGS